MDSQFPINRLLSKALAFIAKNSEETLSNNNLCIQSLKDLIMMSNRKHLLAIKAGLVRFTQSENERNFDNILLGLYLQLIDQQLKKKPIP